MLKRRTAMLGAALVAVAFVGTPESILAQTEIVFRCRAGAIPTRLTTSPRRRNFFKDEGLEVEFIQVNPRLGARRF